MKQITFIIFIILGTFIMFLGLRDLLISYGFLDKNILIEINHKKIYFFYELHPFVKNQGYGIGIFSAKFLDFLLIFLGLGFYYLSFKAFKQIK